MLGIEVTERIYIAVEAVDMRKSIDALTGIVKLQFKLDPFAPCMFVFSNRERNKLKILRWDHNGFWLYYRRLERGTFQWPSAKRGQEQVTRLDYREFRWLLDGLSPEQVKAHKPVATRVAV